MAVWMVETMVMTEQTEKMVKTALMGWVAKIEARGTMETTSQMESTALAVETEKMVMTEQMVMCLRMVAWSSAHASFLRRSRGSHRVCSLVFTK